MKYINKKTGAILDSPSKIYGGDWVEYTKKEAQKEKVLEEKQVAPEKVEKESDLTKADIMNELDALGIEYDKNAKKEDLFKLMMGE